MDQVARGTFEVSMEPLSFEGQPEGSKLGRLSIEKTLVGDLDASTRGQMLSAMTATEGSAGYVALERVEGALHGRSGTFVLQHTGCMDRGKPGLLVQVVPDSGTDELEGLAGTFEISMADGEHTYEFTYSLP